jgi:hypothetical protein
MLDFKPHIEDIDPNSATIEVNFNGVTSGIIVSGKHKGVCFIKDDKGVKKILQSNPFDMKEVIKMYPDYEKL